MTIIFAVLIFIFGTAIGSFLSVIIHRSYKNIKGIFISRSICPFCKKKLKWTHLFPILSYLFLGGKCAYCRKKISPHYLLLELTTGIVFLTIFLNWNFLTIVPQSANPIFFDYGIDWIMFEKFLFFIIEFSFFIGIFFYDLLYKLIPDFLSIPAILIAIGNGLLTGFPSPLNMLIGALAIGLFFALQFLLSKGKWIGGGDIRLGILIGAVLGWEKALIALVTAYVIGAIFSIILLIKGKANRKTAIAFGPFLIIGVTTAIFYGDIILNFYLSFLII